jgi:hypothetical protein
MRRGTLRAIPIILVIASGACATLSPRPRISKIEVSNTEIRLDDTVMKSPDDLRDELLKRQPCEVRLVPDQDTKYAAVAEALRAVQAAGCKTGIVGNMQP